MTTLTLQRRVASQQWEASLLVTLDHVRDVPGLRRVASNTVAAELTLVHVRVA
jgi:hypothetical protein